MSRLLVTALGAIVVGAVFWVVLGFLAANVFTRMPGGAREGAGAMAGFFYVGGLCGFVGLIVGGWGVWRLLADPQRLGTVAWGLTGLLLMLIVGGTIALRPKVVLPDDFHGRAAQLRVELSFPDAWPDGLPAQDRLTYEFRSADGTEETPALRDQLRKDGERSIVPAVFPVRRFPRSKLLAVMKNDQQIVCATLTVEGNPESTTEWSGWQDLEGGVKARWRLVVGE